MGLGKRCPGSKISVHLLYLKKCFPCLYLQMKNENLSHRVIRVDCVVNVICTVLCLTYGNCSVYIIFNNLKTIAIITILKPLSSSSHQNTHKPKTYIHLLLHPITLNLQVIILASIFHKI